MSPGQVLRTAAGTYIQVSAVQHETAWQRVDNLTVAGLHTFHVGAGSVLVHNANPVCGSYARTLLKLSLGPSPYQTGQAHHIVGVARYNGDTGQKLHNLGVEFQQRRERHLAALAVDRREHGVLRGSIHRGMSSDTYTSFVENYLDVATTKADALSRLNGIKVWLTNGCMPINIKGGVVRKPAKGTCPQILVDHYRIDGKDWELEA